MFTIGVKSVYSLAVNFENRTLVMNWMRGGWGWYFRLTALFSLPLIPSMSQGGRHENRSYESIYWRAACTSLQKGRRVCTHACARTHRHTHTCTQTHKMTQFPSKSQNHKLMIPFLSLNLSQVNTEAEAKVLYSYLFTKIQLELHALLPFCFTSVANYILK